MCNYCKGGYFKIKQAYGRDKMVNDEIQICIDGDYLSIDYETEEAFGFYIDIEYCPMCGRKLKINQ